MSDKFGEQIKIPDAIILNKLIQEYMVVNAHNRAAEIEAFVNSSNKTSILVMEVFKGLIASRRA
uniref:Uncharacterized protein n=1 Tax=Fundidesulfovibrio putealis TaxID=270496 RepID=A0A7C3W888_9BACT